MTFLVLLGAQIGKTRPPTGNRRGPFPYLFLSARPLIVCAVLVASAILGACGSGSPPDLPTVPATSIDDTNRADVRTVPRVAPGGGPAHLAQGGYLFLNQRWIEGISSDGPDLGDVDSVFWHVFSRLPDQVMVYPTEHYYYFQLHISGRRFHDNFRLPAKSQEQGGIYFNYFEFSEFPTGGRSPSGTTKYYTQADGVRVVKVDDFTYRVTHRAKTVTFNHNRLPQEPPKLFSLGEDEAFIERTFDESGYQFFLLFNDEGNYPF